MENLPSFQPRQLFSKHLGIGAYLAGILFFTGVISTVTGIFLFTYITMHFVHREDQICENPRYEQTGMPPLPPPSFPYKKKVRYDWALRDLNGNRVDFAAFEGKNIFLNFWATWSPLCIREMKTIDKFYEKFKDNITVICVALDGDAKLKEFLKTHNYTMPVYTLYTDPPDELTNETLPTTFLLDKSGLISFKYSEAADWNHPESINFIFDFLQGQTAERR